MSVATLNLADLDINKGSFECTLEAKGKEIDDNNPTAAYFVASYLYHIVTTSEFTEGVEQYAKTLAEKMEEELKDGLEPSDEPTACKLIFTDKDITVGSFMHQLYFEENNNDGKAFPTIAQLVGLYMQTLVLDKDFMRKVFIHAQEEISDIDGADLLNDYDDTIDVTSDKPMSVV